MQRFTHVKSQFREKNTVLPIAKFPSILQEYDDVTTPYFSISSLLSVKCRFKEVKNKRKCETFSSRSGRGMIREVVAYKRFHIMIWQGNVCALFWKTDRWGEVVATGGSTVFEFQLTKPFTVRGSITLFPSLTDLALNSNKVLLLLSSFFKLRCITMRYILQFTLLLGRTLNRNSTSTRSSIFLMLKTLFQARYRMINELRSMCYWPSVVRSRWLDFLLCVYAPRPSL